MAAQVAAQVQALHDGIVRTTNRIGRLLWRAKRRTGLTVVSTNRAGCNRILHGLSERIQRNWSRRTLTESTRVT